MTLIKTEVESWFETIDMTIYNILYVTINVWVDVCGYDPIWGTICIKYILHQI